MQCPTSLRLHKGSNKDLYKVYVDDLGILQDSNIGGIIGSIRLNAAACADDIISPNVIKRTA